MVEKIGFAAFFANNAECHIVDEVGVLGGGDF